MSQTLIPSSVEELLREYDYYITGIIVDLSRGGIDGERVLELKQQVALQLLRTSYLERYTPGRVKFTTYLYFLVRSVVIDAYKHWRAENGSAVSLDALLEPPRRVVQTYEDRTANPRLHSALSTPSGESSHVASDWLDRFEVYLAGRTGKTVEYEGSRMSRVLVIFKLTRDGWSSSEIAGRLGMTVAAVAMVLSRIRTEALTFDRCTRLRASAA